MRQYVSKQTLNKDGLLEITGKDFRYMHQVLRLKAGDMVTVRLPDGSLVNMTLCRADDNIKKITLQKCDTQEDSLKDDGQENTQKAEFYLFMFIPKPSKFDLIVRQATECGISKIFPVKSEFSQSGSEKMNFRGERFERIIKEARQQSGSPVATEVEDCIDISRLCTIWQNEIKTAAENNYKTFGCVLYERNDFTSNMKTALSSIPASDKIKKCALICGNEGGISPEELQRLLQSGFKAVHFETNILRCETAALYGTAVLQNSITERESIPLSGDKNEKN